MEVQRGGITESIHRGHVAVVNSAGRIIASAGNPGFVTFLRSSAKFHQALPLIASGAVDRFGFTASELAIICSSHAAEEKHLVEVRSILHKTGLTENHLHCGAHPPFSSDASEKLVREGKSPTPIHNNCSGKHAGMLALALHLGAPLENYLDLHHPVQQKILAVIAEFAGLIEKEIAVAVDGCSAPTFAISVAAMARMFANLVRPPQRWESSCGKLWPAIVSHPDLISNGGELDCELMRDGSGLILAKGGAEAVLCAAIKPGEPGGESLGLAIKIEDGTGKRARGLVARAVLEQLGMATFRSASEPILNHRGKIVGENIPRVPLKFN